MLLENKVCITTGAASPRGIGRAKASRFAKEGAKVVILDLDRAAADLGDDHLGISANVADEAAVGSAVSAGIERFGRIRLLAEVAPPCWTGLRLND
jgi:NAD(P)-dependent dehydrogenase (short-subunit alcohol dehydrogenase family)